MITMQSCSNERTWRIDLIQNLKVVVMHEGRNHTNKIAHSRLLFYLLRLLFLSLRNNVGIPRYCDEREKTFYFNAFTQKDCSHTNK